MSIKRVLIAAGGTGGHLYPAQGLAQQLSKETNAPSFLFVAGGLATNRCFDGKYYPFKEVACSPLFSKNPIKLCKGMLSLCRGIWQSRQILKSYRPDLVVGFGSYYTVAPLLAAKSLNIPIVLHEANSVPGKANRWLASLATYIGIHFPQAAAYLPPHKTQEVELPLRPGYALAEVSKAEACHYFGLAPDQRILLVFGGSQGAQAINHYMYKLTPALRLLEIQIIHFTGKAEQASQLRAQYAAYQIPAVVKEFETHMHYAWRAANAFVGRSGASTIAEATEFEVPALLIPYPHATNQHQAKNADFFVETVQGGKKLLETHLTEETLLEALQNLLQKETLAQLKKGIQLYKQRPQRTTLCQLILNLKV